MANTGESLDILATVPAIMVTQKVDTLGVMA